MRSTRKTASSAVISENPPKSGPLTTRNTRRTPLAPKDIIQEAENTLPAKNSRKPGRPRKNNNNVSVPADDKENVAVPLSTAPLIVLEKVNVQSRRPGRAKVVEKENPPPEKEKIPEHVVDDPPAPVRSRGRPKKVPTEEKVEEIVPVSEPKEIEPEIPVVPEDKGRRRGRPKKSLSLVPVPPTPTNVLEEELQETGNQVEKIPENQSKEVLVEETKASETASPRGRGRPRKTLPGSEGSFKAPKVKAEKPKRGRGRPKKKGRNSSFVTPEESSIPPVESEAEVEAPQAPTEEIKEPPSQPEKASVPEIINLPTPPAISKPTQSQVPFQQRSPVYLQVISTTPSPVTTSKKTINPVAPPTVKPTKRPAGEDPFQLMPLKQRNTKKAKVDRPLKPLEIAPTVIDKDDVYGFDFNESQEPPKPTKQKGKKTGTAAKKPKTVKTKAATSKKVELPGLMLWDEKDFVQRQRQIKINVKNKDYKAPEKPIPPPPVPLMSMKKTHQGPPPLPQQLNSTMRSSIREPPQIISVSYLESPMNISNLMKNSRESGGGSGDSKLIPWRYSTIRNSTSLANASIPQNSLNDSNGENVNPQASLAKGQSTIHQRPLHTLQPQRSPMKELNPQATILVPRPLGIPKKVKKSPLKTKKFDLDNNFGFESDEEENQENLQEVREKINDKLDSLKRFRHSLTVASPLVPLRQKKVPQEPRQVTALKNIFTSTPQQQKTIREAFQASTPIAGPSRNINLEKEPAEEGDPKLFESLTFEAPPKRNYSMVAPRRKRTINFLGISDDEYSEDEGETLDKSVEKVQPGPSKKKSKVQKVQEEKLAQFVEEFNSMCEEVDQYELVIE